MWTKPSLCPAPASAMAKWASASSRMLSASRPRIQGIGGDFIGGSRQLAQYRPLPDDFRIALLMLAAEGVFAASSPGKRGRRCSPSPRRRAPGHRDHIGGFAVLPATGGSGR